MSARCLKTSGLGPLLSASVEPLLSNLHDMNYTLQDSSKAAVLVEKQAVLQIHADTPNISAPPEPPVLSPHHREWVFPRSRTGASSWSAATHPPTPLLCFRFIPHQE